MKDIDLTLDRKFARFPHSEFFDNLIDKATRLPWRCRKIDHNDLRYEKRKNDGFSNDYGKLLRKLNNKIIVMESRSELEDYVLRDFLYECNINPPYLDKECICCGTKHFTKQVDICEKCQLKDEIRDTIKKLFPKKEFKKFIPWKDYYYDRQNGYYYPNF